MEKLWRRVVLAVLVWVVVNVVIVGFGWWQSVGVVDSMRDGEFGGVGNKLGRVEKSLFLFKVFSLGGYRLPYVNDVYELAWSGVRVFESSNSIINHVGQMGQNVMRGVEQDYVGFEKVFNDLDDLTIQVDQVGGLLNSKRMVKLARTLGKSEVYDKNKIMLSGVQQFLYKLQSFEPVTSNLLGYEGRRHYIVLMQNNMELRPTGGYLGSYAEVWFKNGAIEDLLIQDIGFPNGQIKGYVKEPDPIRNYLFSERTPGWSLRDANWEPDFPEAAETLHWFFREGGLDEADGIVAINLLPIKDLLDVVGPLEIADYDLRVDADSFYMQAQQIAEESFFDGSTQKGDFLGVVGRQLLYVMTTKQLDLATVGKVIGDNLLEGQIMVALFDDREAEVIQTLGWDGELMPIDCGEDCFADYWYLNEANLGINKTNCCVDREVKDEIFIDKGTVGHTLIIEYVNHNPATPNPPKAWGGGYKNYLRVFVPRDSKGIKILIDGERVKDDLIDFVPSGDKLSIGFLVMVQGGRQGEVEINYTLPHRYDETSLPRYNLIVQKQSGVDELPVSLVVNNDDGESYEKSMVISKNTVIGIVAE